MLVEFFDILTFCQFRRKLTKIVPKLYSFDFKFALKETKDASFKDYDIHIEFVKKSITVHRTVDRPQKIRLFHVYGVL